MDSICIAVTVRADFTIIDKFIKYHLSRGIDEILVFLDDPIFNKNIPDYSSSVKFILCDKYYWENIDISVNGYKVHSRPEAIEQRQFSNYLYAAEITQCDWLANIDIDELIYSPYCLNSILSLLPLYVFSIRMKSAEAIYDKTDPSDIFDTEFFKINSIKNNKISSKFYDKSLLSNNGFWGHRLGKILARTTEVIKRISNHYIWPNNENLITDIEFDFLYLLHFEGMTKSYFIEKQIRRFSKEVIVQNLSAREFKRLNYFKKCYIEKNENGLIQLYNSMHLFQGDRLEMAIDTGFVEKIQYHLPIKEYNRGLEDFHFTNLYYSFIDNKVLASSSGETPVLMLEFKYDECLKAIFFIRDTDQFKTLVINDGNFEIDKSKIFRLIDVVRKDCFFVFKDNESYLISFSNGTVHFKSKNLGDWELFEKKDFY